MDKREKEFQDLVVGLLSMILVTNISEPRVTLPNLCLEDGIASIIKDVSDFVNGDKDE